MVGGIGAQDFNIRGTGALRPNGQLHTPPPVDDDAAFNFLESWTSSSTAPDTSNQLSLDKMLQLQSGGGSAVPQTVAELPPKEKNDDHVAREIEFLVKTNRNVFKAHSGALGSEGMGDGWNLSH